MFVSEFDRARLARPEKRTGLAYIFSDCTQAAKLPRWFLAVPTNRFAARALLCAAKRRWRFGELPSHDRSIPTWSACLEKGMTEPLIMIGL